MKTPFFLVLNIALLFNIAVKAQVVTVRKPIKLDDMDSNLIVQDSSGLKYNYANWKAKLATGNYILVKTDYKNHMSKAYTISKLSPEEQTIKMVTMPKPKQSGFFTNGEKMRLFTLTDIDGNRYKEKNMAGKVIVFNFWFVNCPPCRAEIPELNKIREKYANNPNVLFIAIALDNKEDILHFIKNNPFNYNIVDDGRAYTDDYEIKSYPTNVVVNKEGNVVFNATGYATNVPYWIEKSIEEANK